MTKNVRIQFLENSVVGTKGGSHISQMDLLIHSDFHFFVIWKFVQLSFGQIVAVALWVLHDDFYCGYAKNETLSLSRKVQAIEIVNLGLCQDLGFVLRTPTLRASSQFRNMDCGLGKA